jgi:hypothetical protein
MPQGASISAASWRALVSAVLDGFHAAPYLWTVPLLGLLVVLVLAALWGT